MQSIRSDYSYNHNHNNNMGNKLFSMGQAPEIMGGATIFDWPPWNDDLISDVFPNNTPAISPPPRQHLNNLKISAASIYIPKDNPEKPSGEDAHFISTSEHSTFGVADGVGGWAKKGIDGGEYARQLMYNCVLALHNFHHKPTNPKKILEEAYKKTAAEGSSTACIVTLAGEKLRAVNVGDSGFLVIRGGDLIYQSATQKRGFNCPYQLGLTRDDPSVAEEIEVSVEDGDTIVVGTDGLLDNMHASEIVEVVRRGTAQDLMTLSCYMANAALYNSFDRYAHTPFSMAAREGGKDYRGGKPDDITVIIARVNRD